MGVINNIIGKARVVALHSDDADAAPKAQTPIPEKLNCHDLKTNKKKRRRHKKRLMVHWVHSKRRES